MSCPPTSASPISPISLFLLAVGKHLIIKDSSSPPSDYLKFSSDYSHSVVGGTGSARGMRSASELRDLMDTLQRKKIALENSLRANGSANPSYFSVTQVRPPPTTFIGCCVGCS